MCLNSFEREPRHACVTALFIGWDINGVNLIGKRSCDTDIIRQSPECGNSVVMQGALQAIQYISLDEKEFMEQG
jgi:hypothetical protein